jgi:two-component system, chemotaxis family, protein-glutamate methylesterase/glutaminase
MPTQNVVVIGTSAGGIDALRTIVGALPADFPAPICVVMHTSPQSPGVLHDILSRAGPLRGIDPTNGHRLKPGNIYVAPPDCHLVVEPGRLRVTKGPRENRFRPAIDPLFRSAAQVYGPSAIGVILTGNLDDGTAGLWAIKQLGGIAIVQDPTEAQFPSMPRSAVTHVAADHVVPLADVAPLLIRLTAVHPAEARAGALSHLDVEVNIVKEQNAVDAGIERIGAPSPYACPECHGVLLQLQEGGRVRFRCHTGHAYSIESLLAAVSEGIEESLWIAVRALEEGRLLLDGMAAHMRASHDGAGAEKLAERAEESKRHAEIIRQLATEREPLSVSRE